MSVYIKCLIDEYEIIEHLVLRDDLTTHTKSHTDSLRAKRSDQYRVHTEEVYEQIR